MIDLKIKRVYFPKCEPVKISLGLMKRESYLILLDYKGIQGVGAANPFKAITGDSPKDLVRDAKKVLRIPLTPGKDGPKRLHEYLNNRIKSKTLQSAIDSAYHDIIGKIKGVPVYKLYSQKMFTAPNSITVFLKDSVLAAQKEAAGIYKKFPDLKILKIKLNGKNDIQVAKAIKKVSPKRMKFILDANQAYKNPVKAVQILNELSKILGKVLLVEQPCPKHDIKSLKYISDNLKSMLVFADESAATFEDVKKLALKKAVKGVNIKLQKAGGLYPAVKMAEFCKSNGLKIMVGAMIEDTIGLTIDAHFAAINSHVVLTDLDTDIDAPKYINGGSFIKNGHRKISNSAGLGIKLDFKKSNRDVISRSLLY